MRKLLAAMLVATTLGACNTVRGAASDVASVAEVFDPNRTYATCGSYGLLDRDNDGRISQAEYDAYRLGAYGYWDVNGDGRISQAEYANCWYGGGFYTTYNRGTYMPSYSAWDVNRDGYLSSDEYWGTAYWPSLDRNGDGFIDSTEWPW